MFTVIWRFVSPYVTPLLLGVLAVLLGLNVFLGIKAKTQGAEIVKLTAQSAEKQVVIDTLKREADAQVKRLSEAEKQATATVTRTAVRIKYIKESALLASATCDEAAAWAKKLAMERKQ